MSDERDHGYGSSSPDGSYRFIRPESKEVLYRDAGVESTEDAAQMPRYYAPQKKTPKPSRAKQTGTPRGFFVRAACMCLVCAILGGITGGGLTAAMIYKRTESAQLPQSEANDNDLPSLNPVEPTVTPIPDSSHQAVVSNINTVKTMDASEIYQMACEQVVGIKTEVTYKNFFGQTSSTAVSGSGFILSEDGYIITNYHVIEYADQYGYDVNVMMYDGTTYTASIVGTEADNDIAVLQIDATELNAVTLGNSDLIQVGDDVQPVGNPLGELDFTMTFGRITALDRKITTDDHAPPINMFQMDAAVNNGNSGGPVYNSKGEVIGVVTAKYSEVGIEGLGFAIPINDAVRIATDLITNGYVTGKAYLGANVKTMYSTAALYYNSVEGAYVFSVEADSPAEAAGLKAGDVIFQIDDVEITTEEGLRAALRGYVAGDTAELSVFRSGETVTLTVTLGEELPEQTILEQAEPSLETDQSAA